MVSVSASLTYLTVALMVCFVRQFYSSRESARYKMPEWFISVGQVSLNKEMLAFKATPINFEFHIY